MCQTTQNRSTEACNELHGTASVSGAVVEYIMEYIIHRLMISNTVYSVMLCSSMALTISAKMNKFTYSQYDLFLSNHFSFTCQPISIELLIIVHSVIIISYLHCYVGYIYVCVAITIETNRKQQKNNFAAISQTMHTKPKIQPSTTIVKFIVKRC